MFKNMKTLPIWAIELEREMIRIQDGEIFLTIRHGYPERMKATQFKMITKNHDEQIRLDERDKV